MKRMLLLLVLVLGFGFALPTKADASEPIVGRITDYSATSVSVRDKEILTVMLDESTTYTKLITQKPWQADTQLSAGALSVGRFVAVHVLKDNPNVADWVQIATDMRSVAPTATASPVFSAPQSAPALSTTSKAKSSDLLSSKQVKALIATANTPADHIKLQNEQLTTRSFDGNLRSFRKSVPKWWRASAPTSTSGDGRCSPVVQEQARPPCSN